jgi:hypothetical protein
MATSEFHRGLVHAKPDLAHFCQELLEHRGAEDRFFVPGVRRAGRLISSDVAFRDARDAEHRHLGRVTLGDEFSAVHRDTAT